MELLTAVNTVLPYMGEHVITRIVGAKHPTVDLILAAIDRNRSSILQEGLWFNELIVTLQPNTENQIEVPVDTLAIYGITHTVSLDGTRLFNLSNGTRYFSSPVQVRLVRDIPFEKLPQTAALTVVYMAAVEVYLADFGRENTIPELQTLAERNYRMLKQEDLRNRRYRNESRLPRISRRR